MISRKTYRCRIGYFRTVGYTGPVAVKGREQVFHGDLWSQNDLRFIVTMAGIVYGIAQILPLSVIQIQLLISGLEPNPGPLTANSKVIEMNTDILESSDVGKRTRSGYTNLVKRPVGPVNKLSYTHSSLIVALSHV
ncbi:hypothetical protein DPMN_148926 [Dreissena polymorpha]|uniref:Uncharacterized protein n=1 Tax=Dreissena polymorpha TaxID=45954 RepID=A0A9D4FCQ1_DREPO|nr:hypothetical protein DPMN_148926 [Dreissena polymorpha]